MARIRVLQGIAGLDFSWAPGELVELDDAEAAKWADGVRAELADTQPPEDKPARARATAARTEKAAERSRGGGRGRRTETR